MRATTKTTTAAINNVTPSELHTIVGTIHIDEMDPVWNLFDECLKTYRAEVNDDIYAVYSAVMCAYEAGKIQGIRSERAKRRYRAAGCTGATI